jgi:hypothetical protein
MGIHRWSITNRGVRKFVILIALCISVSASGSECTAGYDPFSPSGIMPSGSMAGRCLEINHQVGDPDIPKRRSFRTLTPEEASKVVPLEVIAAADPDIRYIANVSHDGDFWVGMFHEMDAIESISFQVERFPPEWIAAHTELRFNLKAGKSVRLFSQTDPLKAATEISNFIMTVEGVPVVGGPKFNLVDALKDKFGLAKRIVSLEDKVKTVIFKEMNTVYQYPLAFSADQKNGFWKMALEDLSDPEMKQVYHLLRKNCTNSLFELLDHFLGRERKLNSRVATTLSIFARRSLLNRKIIDTEVELETLNKEFNGPVRKLACKKLLDPVVK